MTNEITDLQKEFKKFESYQHGRNHDMVDFISGLNGSHKILIEKIDRMEGNMNNINIRLEKEIVEFKNHVKGCEEKNESVSKILEDIRSEMKEERKEKKKILLWCIGFLVSCVISLSTYIYLNHEPTPELKQNVETVYSE